MKIHHLLFSGLVLSVLWAVLAQAQSLPVGQIVERVTCRADATQSYALYLPQGYDAARPWPILYGFDPGGRGLRPVELYKEAAEKYGYIVVGSHNSRNGLGGELRQILNTLWQDTHERLAINEKRVYLTGMSGGARVALSLARSIPDQVAGVIACAAGGPTEVQARKDLPYAVIGIAGHEDFNLLELKQLTEALTKAGAVNRLVTFAGGHSWPPVEVATQAVGWLELQAMKTGRRPQDANWLAAWQSQQLAEAGAAEADQRWLVALKIYEALAQDVQGLADVTAFANRAKELRAKKQVKDSLKQEKLADELQQQESNSFFNWHKQLKPSDANSFIFGMLQATVRVMRKRSLVSEESPERTASRRVLNLLGIFLNEENSRLRANNRYREMTMNALLLVEARPDHPQAYFNLARAQALSGSKKQALESLQQAVAHGLNDAQQIRNNPDLESLRAEPAYKQLLERISGK